MADSAAPEPVVQVASPTTTGREKGVAPIKPEYLKTKEETDQRVSLDANNKTRGMNKGSQREHAVIERSGERPTFEGEVNFLAGEALSKVKVAVREKRIRTWDADKDPGKKEEAKGEVGVEKEATAEEKATEGQGTAQKETKEAAAIAGGKPGLGISDEDRRERQARSRKLFEDKLILAPLTTVGNLPFRRICKEFGVDNTVSEMAMVFNLNRTQKSEWSLLRRHESEDIFGLQIAVNRPDEAASFAKAIHASGFSYDWIDINCGCPVDLICNKGCGCGLWEKKGKLRDITKVLTQYQPAPVTIKCRIGADEHNPTLHNVIKEYESWGASAVTVHGRSRKQRYTKLANWEYIERVSHLTTLPTVGNGDVFSYEDIVERKQVAPNVNSFMIGRGALIKPWVFEEIKQEKIMDISSHERFEMLKRYANYGLAHWGADERGVATTRRFLCEWLSFLCRYIPVGLLEVLPQRMNDRPPAYNGRDDMETLMASDSVEDWIKITEMLLGPRGPHFKFTPKHKSNSYASTANTAAAKPEVEQDQG